MLEQRILVGDADLVPVRAQPPADTADFVSRPLPTPTHVERNLPALIWTKLQQDLAWRANGTNSAGVASYWLGDTADAIVQLEHTVRHGHDVSLLVIRALRHLAMIHTEQAEWDRAEARDALDGCPSPRRLADMVKSVGASVPCPSGRQPPHRDPSRFMPEDPTGEMVARVAERVVLLDSAGEVCGSALKSEVHNHNTPLHLAFSCYLYNDAGEVLVTRRALSKLAWPGVWSNSCCGHPAPAEKTEDAVTRRVFQELGLTVDELGVQLADFRYRAVDVGGVVENEVCPVYSGRVRGAISADPEEVCDLAWIQVDDLVLTATRCPWLLSPWAAQQIVKLDERRLMRVP